MMISFLQAVVVLFVGAAVWVKIVLDTNGWYGDDE